MLHDINSQHSSDAVSIAQSVMTTNSHRLSRLYPAIVGVFTSIYVRILHAPPQGRLLGIEEDMSNAKLMVFQTGKGSCKMFLQFSRMYDISLSLPQTICTSTGAQKMRRSCPPVRQWVTKPGNSAKM